MCATLPERRSFDESWVRRLRAGSGCDIEDLPSGSQQTSRRVHVEQRECRIVAESRRRNAQALFRCIAGRRPRPVRDRTGGPRSLMSWEHSGRTKRLAGNRSSASPVCCRTACRRTAIRRDEFHRPTVFKHFKVVESTSGRTTGKPDCTRKPLTLGEISALPALSKRTSNRFQPTTLFGRRGSACLGEISDHQTRGRI